MNNRVVTFILLISVIAVMEYGCKGTDVATAVIHYNVGPVSRYVVSLPIERSSIRRQGGHLSFKTIHGKTIDINVDPSGGAFDKWLHAAFLEDKTRHFGNTMISGVEWKWYQSLSSNGIGMTAWAHTKGYVILIWASGVWDAAKRDSLLSGVKYIPRPVQEKSKEKSKGSGVVSGVKANKP